MITNLVFEGLRCQYLVCKHVLLQVVDLDELHATLGADVWPDVLVLHQVVLKLATIGEGLVAFAALEGGWALMADLVPFEVGMSGKLQTTLRTDVTVTTLVLGLVGAQFTGVGEAPAAEAATVGLDVTVLQHVPLEMAGLGKGLFADCALVWPRALVRQQVRLQVAGLLEELSTVHTLVGFDAVVAEDVRDQVVFRGIGLLAHAALPALQTFSHIHAVRLVDLHVDIQPIDLHSSTQRVLAIRPCHGLAPLFIIPCQAHLGSIVSYNTGLIVASHYWRHIFFCGFQI